MVFKVKLSDRLETMKTKLIIKYQHNINHYSLVIPPSNARADVWKSETAIKDPTCGAKDSIFRP